jgi:aspartate/methionine/tyrosine aminotransferase
MLELAQRVPAPIMLVNGDPNFRTPGHIIEAAAEAALQGATGYAPGGGIKELREAIAGKVTSKNGLTASAEQICVTTGACGGLFTSLMLTVGPGDDVLVPDPGWSNYAAMVHVLGARMVPYPVGSSVGWSLDTAAVESAVTDRTKVIIVNSPSNPGGVVESPQLLAEVVAIAERRDLWVLSDEAYDELLFEGHPTSTAALGDPGRVISVFSLSKTYAMTGWRVGYVVATSEFIRQLSLHQEPVVSCASTISQHAALAALQGPQDCVGEMVNAYRTRRDSVEAELDALGCGYRSPQGAFFIVIDIRPTGLDSWSFARRLLDEEGVGVVPGAAFGDGGEGYVRVTLAAQEDTLAEGVARLGRFVDRATADSSGRAPGVAGVADGPGNPAGGGVLRP